MSAMVNDLVKALRTLGLKRAARDLTVADQMQELHRSKQRSHPGDSP